MAHRLSYRCSFSALLQGTAQFMQSVHEITHTVLTSPVRAAAVNGAERTHVMTLLKQVAYHRTLTDGLGLRYFSVCRRLDG